MKGRQKQSRPSGRRHVRGPGQFRGGEPDRASLMRLGAALAAEEREPDSGWQLPGGEDLTRFAFRAGFASLSLLPETSLVAMPQPPAESQTHGEQAETVTARPKRARWQSKRGA